MREPTDLSLMWPWRWLTSCPFSSWETWRSEAAEAPRDFLQRIPIRSSPCSIKTRVSPGEIQW